MEDAQPAQSGNSGKSKLLRYALRSGTKSKEEKPPAAADLSNSSASRRGRSASSVSKSVGVLDLSGKDKPAKPPRRLSIQAKSAATPAPKLVGNITPISEARVKRSATSQGKSETPLSDVSRSSSRKKYSILSSASYWVSQIKYSEDAAKHSISLGFFKLALDAGCEPLQLMRDKLKSYARRHNLSEYGEVVKELFESYNIVENTEQLQVSETCSQVPEEGTRSSDDEIRSSSSTVGATRKLKPKSLNTDAAQVSSVTESAKKDTKRNTPVTRSRGTLTKNNNANSRSVSEAGSHKSVKKTQNPSKQEFNKEKDIIKKKGRKVAGEQGSVSPPAEIAPQENKENMEASSMEEISLNEAV